MKELKLNGSIISNSSELSNAFNDHFSAIGLRLANEIPPNDNNNDFSYISSTNVNNNKFRFSTTSSSIVFSHLNKLCRSKATGHISAKIIREFQFLYVISLINLCSLVYFLTIGNVLGLLRCLSKVLFKYCVHEKQVLVRLVVDSFAYCLGKLGLFKLFLYS